MVNVSTTEPPVSLEEPKADGVGNRNVVAVVLLPLRMSFPPRASLASIVVSASSAEASSVVLEPTRTRAIPDAEAFEPRVAALAVPRLSTSMPEILANALSVKVAPERTCRVSPQRPSSGFTSSPPPSIRSPERRVPSAMEMRSLPAPPTRLSERFIFPLCTSVLPPSPPTTVVIPAARAVAPRVTAADPVRLKNSTPETRLKSPSASVASVPMESVSTPLPPDSRSLAR